MGIEQSEVIDSAVRPKLSAVRLARAIENLRGQECESDGR